MPLVVTDDDVSGTFTFLRALAEHGVSADLTAEKSAKPGSTTSSRSARSCGGAATGIRPSTRHGSTSSAGLPPRCPARSHNGTTVAEQIGAQIFIDGWAIVAPGNPSLPRGWPKRPAGESRRRSDLCGQAFGRDGGRAFRSTESTICSTPGCRSSRRFTYRAAGHRRARLASGLTDWRDAQKIEDQYGYDKFPGNCHVVPNHALIISACSIRAAISAGADDRQHGRLGYRL